MGLAEGPPRRWLSPLLLLLIPSSKAFLPRVTGPAGLFCSSPAQSSRTQPPASVVLWSSPFDPSGEMVKRKVASQPNQTAASSPSPRGGRSQMPPLRESMALLFSPDKRRIDQNRQKFRDLVNELLTSPMEAIIPTVTSNVPFLLSTNSSIFMQEMLEDLEAVEEGTMVPVGNFRVTVEQQRASLTNLFTLMMDYIELFIQHTRSEARSHQAVLREILEAAQTGNDTAVDAKIVELRPYFREDFITYLQSEYNRITTPPMTDQAVTLANLLQLIQARLLTEMETLVGSEVGLVSKLLAYEDDAKLTTALRGSFTAGTVDPRQFMGMLETVLHDLDERLPGPLGGGKEADELRVMQSKLRVIRSFTEDFLRGST